MDKHRCTAQMPFGKFSQADALHYSAEKWRTFLLCILCNQEWKGKGTDCEAGDRVDGEKNRRREEARKEESDYSQMIRRLREPREG